MARSGMTTTGADWNWREAGARRRGWGLGGGGRGGKIRGASGARGHVEHRAVAARASSPLPCRRAHRSGRERARGLLHDWAGLDHGVSSAAAPPPPPPPGPRGGTNGVVGARWTQCSGAFEPVQQDVRKRVYFLWRAHTPRPATKPSNACNAPMMDEGTHHVMGGCHVCMLLRGWGSLGSHMQPR
jgi:hypothetical protein